MNQAPVRYRNGFSNQGGKDARYLDDSNPVPYLKKRRLQGDGSTVVAHKKGRFLEVTIENALDGYYSIGTIAGERRIFGSPTARGRFRNRGPALAGDGSEAITQLYFYGRGLGMDYSISDAGTVVDLDGSTCRVFLIEVYLTRTGRSMEPHYVFNAVEPFDYGTLIQAVRGANYAGVGGRKFQAGFVFQSITSGGQHFHAFLRDDGEVQSLGNTLVVPDQLAGFAVTGRLGPAAFVLMGTYLRPNYSGSTVDAAACPGLIFQFSTDAGESWALAASTELFQEFFDTVQTLPVPFYASTFNTAVQAAGLTVAPLGANVALAYAVVPYAPNPGVDFVIKAKVKLGLIDTAARTLQSTLTLFDGTIDEAVAFWGGGCFSVKGGAIVVTRPIPGTGLTSLQDEPPVLLFTPDGVATSSAVSPQPNYRMGTVAALGPELIAAPMYDGAHSFYESEDRGATWRKRATISDEADAPVSAPGKYLLDEFAVVTWLRRQGQPANGTPGAPWVSDSRIAVPIL